MMEFLWDNYVNSTPEKVISQIPKRAGFDCSILGIVSSKICTSREDLNFFMQMTFFGSQVSEEDPHNYKKVLQTHVETEINRLLKMGFIFENERLEITDLGLRCAEELLSPDTAHFLYDVVKKNETKIQKTDDYEQLVSGIIHLCCCTNDARLLFPPRTRTEAQELEATWVVNNEQYFFKPVEREIFLKSFRTTRMILRWIEGTTYFDLSSYAPAGTVKGIAANLQWVSRGLARFTERPLFDFKDDFINFLYILSERIYFGVPEEALSIIRLRIKGLHRRRAINLAMAGYNDVDSLLEASIDEIKKVNGINETLAYRIKKEIERYIENIFLRQKSRQIRLASNMNKNLDLILGLYELHNDDFTRHVVQIFNEEFKINATFIGESSQHEPDILIDTPQGNIVIESKRKKKGKVKVLESEEILGKGAKYRPIANVTIGYPDFVDLAKENAINAKITLITATTIGEILIQFWKGDINTTDILLLLAEGKYVYEIKPSPSELKPS